MIIVREEFHAKPGMASKLAKMFKESWGAGKVMTDMSGEYNTVVIEGEYESLAAYEAEMEKYMKEMKEGGDREKKAGPSHTEMYTHGGREFYRVW